VRDTSPASLAYDGPTEALRTVWIAVRGSLRHVLEDVTLQDVLSGRLPKHVVTIADKYGVDERP
jgi:DNA-binding IscR family transcriptional regulator